MENPVEKQLRSNVFSGWTNMPCQKIYNMGISWNTYPILYEHFSSINWDPSWKKYNIIWRWKLETLKNLLKEIIISEEVKLAYKFALRFYNLRSLQHLSFYSENGKEPSQKNCFNW